MRTETLSDEQAVRGAHPGALPTSHVWRDQEARELWMNASLLLDVEASEADGYLGKDWANARQHPTVVAWEAKQGQSAKVERPIARRVFTGPMNVYRQAEVDAYMDAIEAERDQLLAENARLREVKRG